MYAVRTIPVRLLEFDTNTLRQKKKKNIVGCKTNCESGLSIGQAGAYALSLSKAAAWLTRSILYSETTTLSKEVIVKNVNDRLYFDRLYRWRVAT
jgi:hypothetical protein